MLNNSLSSLLAGAIAVCGLFSTTAAAAESRLVHLSDEGSGRATAYLESPKIISYEGKTHVAWLDSPEEGFRIRMRTLDQATGSWSKTYEIGEAYNNHGGPALTIDEAGYLHFVYYAHHHPLRYRRSLRPNDASAWTEFEAFGEHLTYPALVVGADGTLILVARRSYDDRPWELEMWQRAPGEEWRRQAAVLRARHPGYAQFAAALAWGPDHRTLHLSTRIYELPTASADAALTTVAYMRSEDGGQSWHRSNGESISLPATATAVDVIASASGSEGRIINAGSLDVSPEAVPHVPYSVQVQNSSQVYLATPLGNGFWRHEHLNPALPSDVRNAVLLMHGGIAFGSGGDAVVTAVAMDLDFGGQAWGEPSSEVVAFHRPNGQNSFRSKIIATPDPESPRWLPNLERRTGFNTVPKYPSLIFTDGRRGSSLDDRLNNHVYWVPGTSLSQE